MSSHSSLEMMLRYFWQQKMPRIQNDIRILQILRESLKNGKRLPEYDTTQKNIIPEIELPGKPENLRKLYEYYPKRKLEEHNSNFLAYFRTDLPEKPFRIILKLTPACTETYPPCADTSINQTIIPKVIQSHQNQKTRPEIIILYTTSMSEISEGIFSPTMGENQAEDLVQVIDLMITGKDSHDAWLEVFYPTQRYLRAELKTLIEWKPRDSKQPEQPRDSSRIS